ncbi:hypothetical protein KHP60_14170 [Microvirga sp. 3-52]|uniref:hypothetical protein n=1 Tax=Microvirga sp. 3-52 TaxID=2792425 RepID=UPI001AC928B3|nr:hypothetical protein [Microvirga sp. 3-52]MBO1906356.1 hypothetical protein [Microvirga sp. 3-52]MBS7453474.1 hypothetical protein [Microvirga sp. 3-52]
MATTRTIGPLHLEDLEPHRFEDLARQLLYDFRIWRQLEATGRSGADEGFDARAYEIVEFADQEDTGEADERDLTGRSDRLWMIQCKREKALTPAKIEKYLRELPNESIQGAWGIVFVAACDFSLKTRNTFRNITRELGFSEAYLWGRGEIEDLLFQPKNDHLLFAYFGISLQARQRTLKSDLRARLAIKRKAQRTFHKHAHVLIRDASDERYPEYDSNKELDLFDRGRWQVMTVEGVCHDGIRLLKRRHMAYISPDGEQWDYAETYNDARPGPHSDPWSEGFDERHQQQQEPKGIWFELEPEERGWYEVCIVLPFEAVLDIDEDGDDIFKGPHVFTIPHLSRNGPFRGYVYTSLRTPDGRTAEPRIETRIAKFPRPDEKKR